MSIRFPLKNIRVTDTGDLGAGSVAGVAAYQITLPQDTDNVVMKLTSSVGGATVSATFQTTDDGGTTWYDVVRTPSVGIANNTVANWANVPVVGSNSMKILPSSIVGGAIGSAAASTLAANSSSGLPILSQQARIAFIYTGNVTSNDLAQVDIKVNSQSATA